ncbi:P-loop containing nucleoside triphosphate hydrolase protein [Rhizoclosmatium globosum]|uniref:Elongation factor 2 n=1 Tax=Rhizoclosmatium globosum TaxID=329046 RepID=A0A1Y2AL83_9FUNG|nr:P-loop containing nucleoside triphosphate hydrolase protein [Rhizoclosmatium globosum]|eukprot:ORY23323.1 P-loop containing nucleoside triphosphate hydrolase protein [Rhizoclosmatium globosum]
MVWVKPIRSIIQIRWFSSTLRTRQSAEIPTDRIRNIGIIAHIDAGKTTITERMLYYAGYTQRIGNVDEGSTVTDYLPAERSRGITITSACIPLFWKNHRINLIDTPGHVDFTMEVERSVRILDSAVVLLDGVAGVEAQTETVWRQANRQKIPRLIMVNKMDREGASFPRALAAVENRLKGWGTPVVIQWPVFAETATGIKFRGVMDLVDMEVLDFTANETGSVVKRLKVHSLDQFRQVCGGSGGLLEGIEEERVVSLWTKIEEARVGMVEKLAALDDQVVEAFLEEADGSHLAVKPEVLKPALRRLTGDGKIVPVLCGSAFKNTGVQPVLDAVVQYLPSPAERPAPVATLPNGETTSVNSTDKNFCGLAFKIIHDEKRGAMVFVRVYSGSLEPRTVLFNSTQHISERATKILQMYADDYEEIPRVTSGNIACLVGLTETKTGDTLLIASQHGLTSAPKKVAANASPALIKPPPTALTLETIHLPPPVFVRSVEPVSSADSRKLESALTALVREDPSLVVTTDPDSGQTLLGGMGELHLEIASERLLDTHKCAAQMGKVSISYRETVPADVGPSEYVFDYDKEIFGKHSKVSVRVLVEGMEINEDWIDVTEGPVNVVDLESQLEVKDIFPVPLLMVPAKNGKLIPTAPSGYPSIKEIKDAVKDGINGALARGPILGFPVVNVKVTVLEVKLFKPELTSLAAVRAATGRCMRDLMRGVPIGGGSIKNAPSRLLEPIMDLSVTVPEKYVGNVTKDLTGTRRGNVVSLGTENGDSSAGGSYESHLISATVPLGSMLGYSTTLRGMTAGTGLFSMKLLGYGRMSADREEAVVKEMKGF